jgi:hypothetical protein
MKSSNTREAADKELRSRMARESARKIEGSRETDLRLVKRFYAAPLEPIANRPKLVSDARPAGNSGQGSMASLASTAMVAF